MSQRNEYKPGEIVDITIKGALVEGMADGVLTVDVAPDHPSAMPIDIPLVGDVTVESAPPEMQHGDVWRDHDSDLWLIQMDPDEDGLRAFSYVGCETPGELDRVYGPLTLVHREGGAQ